MIQTDRDVILWKGQAVLHESGFKRLGELFRMRKELFFISLATDANINKSELSTLNVLITIICGPLGWLLTWFGGSPLKQIGEQLEDIEDAAETMDLETRWSQTGLDG